MSSGSKVLINTDRGRIAAVDEQTIKAPYKMVLTIAIKKPAVLWNETIIMSDDARGAGGRQLRLTDEAQWCKTIR